MFSFRYRYVCITFLSIYSYLNILYTVGERLFDFPIPPLFIFSTLALVVLGIWELNRVSEQYVSGIESFFRFTIHPLLLLFLLSILHVIVVCLVSMQVLYFAMQMPFQIEPAHQKLLMAFGFRVNLFLQCINAIVFFMEKLKKTQLEAEAFKKNLVEAQFEALRNQINPHFLFNCFNVLSTLVYKDADTSSMFIAQLSKVYRYLLYNQEKRIVLLKDELSFIEAYLFLLKIRFGDNLHVVNRIDNQDQYVAPAVLQMLIENAIKHNIVSKKSPLKITLYTQNGFIIITNNLQEKTVKEESLRIGIKNIRSRYRFLSNKPVEIQKSVSSFTVKIPLLEVQEQ